MLARVTRARLLWMLVVMPFAAMAAMYALNPFNTPLDDPRARIGGFMMYRAPSISMDVTSF